MSEYDEYDENEQNGPAQLRDALKKAQKALTEERKARAADLERLTELEKKDKARSFESLLQEAGAKPKAARYLQMEGVEPTKEAVTAWLKDNEEFLAPSTQTTTETTTQKEQSSEDYGEILAALQANRELSVDAQDTPNKSEQALLGVLAELGRTAKSEADITNALKALGAPITSGYS